MPLRRAPPKTAAAAPPDDAAQAGITLILNRALAGDDASRERVYALLYAELLRLARSHLSGSGVVSLNPSALVHGAYLRMLRREATPVRDRRALFADASTVMRSVLVDEWGQRRRQARRPARAGDADDRRARPGAAELDLMRSTMPSRPCASVDEREQPRRRMRYFAGMTEEDIASELEVSVPTVKRDWRKARAFLFEQLR